MFEEIDQKWDEFEKRLEVLKTKIGKIATKFKNWYLYDK